MRLIRADAAFQASVSKVHLHDKNFPTVYVYGKKEDVQRHAFDLAHHFNLQLVNTRFGCVFDLPPPPHNFLLLCDENPHSRYPASRTQKAYSLQEAMQLAGIKAEPEQPSAQAGPAVEHKFSIVADSPDELASQFWSSMKPILLRVVEILPRNRDDHVAFWSGLLFSVVGTAWSALGTPNILHALAQVTKHISTDKSQPGSGSVH